MNEIEKVSSLTATDERAKQIYGVCSLVTPAFYKNKTDAEMKSEIETIKLMTSDIQPAVLSEMCKEAVKNYKLIRSTNSKIVFDINYILTFYVDCFEKINSEYDDECCCSEGYTHDPKTGISTLILSNRWDKTKPYKQITKRWISTAKQ